MMANVSSFFRSSPISSGDHPARSLALCPVHHQLRDVEELLAERGLDVSYETIRRWG